MKHSHSNLVAGLLLALGAAGCVPPGDPDPSITVGFIEPTSQAIEGSIHTVTVQLDLVGYTALEEEVSVVLRDAELGSATPGVDYSELGFVVLSFPAGSPTGTTKTVNISPLVDNSFEGTNETLQLELMNVVGGAVLGTAAHAIEVEESDVPSLRFTSAATATPDEGDNAYTMDVEFALDVGDVLDVPVSVTISDSGVGSATEGADYTIDGLGQVTFGVGTSATQTHTVTVTVTDDSTSEGDETIVLSLVNPTNGVLLETSTTHVFTITEDDAPVPATLDVRAVDGGGTTTLASTDELDFGSDTIGGVVGNQFTLELENQGTVPLSISPMDLAGHTRDFRIELELPEELVAPTPPMETVFPLLSVGETHLQGTMLESLDEALEALTGAENVILHGVPLPEGNTQRSALGSHASLVLERMATPIASDAKIVVDGVERPTEELLGDLSMWKGKVLGLEDSDVFLSFSDVGSRGWIRTGEGLDDMLHLVSEETASGKGSSRLVTEGLMDAQRIQAHDGCSGVRYVPGSTDLEESIPGPSGLPTTAEAPSVSIAMTECRVAIETDYQLFQRFANEAAITEYVTQLVAAVSAQYEEDLQVRLVLAYLGVHTTSDDGWTSQDQAGASTGDLLSEFRGAWANNFPVAADVAHFLSGANLGGGIAYVSVLCNQSFGFGVSANMNGFINWNSFNGNPSPLNWDFIVFAHELGHNFGANHTHSYCPPLDQCYSNCEGATPCSTSTLMSYCHTCSGGLNNIQLRFHPFNADIMRSRVASSCLSEIEIGGGGVASFKVTFDPVSDSGQRDATLDFTHDAANAPSPFFVDLTGTANE